MNGYSPYFQAFAALAFIRQSMTENRRGQSKLAHLLYWSEEFYKRRDAARRMRRN